MFPHTEQKLARPPRSGHYPGMRLEPSASSFMCISTWGSWSPFPRSRQDSKETGLLCTQPWIGSAVIKHTKTSSALKEVQVHAEDRLSDRYHPVGPRSEA